MVHCRIKGQLSNPTKAIAEARSVLLCRSTTPAPQWQPQPASEHPRLLLARVVSFFCLMEGVIVGEGYGTGVDVLPMYEKQRLPIPSASLLWCVPQAMESNLFGAALAAPHDLVPLHVFTRYDGQHSTRDSFRVELGLNLRLQLVARFGASPPRRDGREWRGA
jgi:hypothetical protein